MALEKCPKHPPLLRGVGENDGKPPCAVCVLEATVAAQQTTIDAMQLKLNDLVRELGGSSTAKVPAPTTHTKSEPKPAP